MILCVYSLGVVLRAKTTYSLSALLLKESGYPVELAKTLIQDCWTKQRTTRAKYIKRKLLIQNIDKLTRHFARNKSHFPILETTDFVEIEKFLLNVCRKKKVKNWMSTDSKKINK